MFFSKYFKKQPIYYKRYYAAPKFIIDFFKRIIARNLNSKLTRCLSDTH